MKRFIAALVLVAGMLLGTSALAGEAGATPNNPGPNTSCSAGTDHCSTWLPSVTYGGCVVYNVLWDHIWKYGLGVTTPYSFTSNGDAQWRMQVDQWWQCGDQGGVHLIGTVGTWYVDDTVVPHSFLNGVVANHSGIVFMSALYSGEMGGTSNVVQWTKCDPNYGAPQADSWGTYVSRANQPESTFTSGQGTFGTDCSGYWNRAYHREIGYYAFNGALATWHHYNLQTQDGNYHAVWQIALA